MRKNKLIDKIISEPMGGAHRNRVKTYENVKNAIISSFDSLKNIKIDKLIDLRLKKFTSMGVYKS